MEVDCEGCAGCCLDWRPLAEGERPRERRGPREPLDDSYNLVPLGRDEVRAFVDAGWAAALTPRFWRADGDGVTVDGCELAAIEGTPLFAVGPRKPPKPVAPFGTDPRWLETCVFLDPTTLQCRIHDDERYPAECAAYPGHNLRLDAETECERVEAATGDERLLDDAPPDDLDGLVLGPAAVGSRVFVHPEPAALSGTVERAAAGELTRADRAECIATAAAAAPGTTARNDERYRAVLADLDSGDAWIDWAIEDWQARSDGVGAPAPDPQVATTVEDDRGAPGTPGWDALRDG